MTTFAVETEMVLDNIGDELSSIVCAVKILHHFPMAPMAVRYTWRSLEPEPWSPWPVDVLLESVLLPTNGNQPRLAPNVPSRLGPSLLCVCAYYGKPGGTP